MLGERWVEDVVAPGQRDPVGALGAAQGPTPQLSLLEDLGVAQRDRAPGLAADGQAHVPGEVLTEVDHPLARGRRDHHDAVELADDGGQGQGGGLQGGLG